jgi:23S rRNA (guanosine2251-2'-O)-methyltransferase
VAAALRAGRVESLTVERGRATAGAAPIVALAETAGVPIDLVEDVRSIAETTAPQGVVAEARPLPLRTLDELAAATDPPAILVLDRVQDARNVGAAARSALAAGIGGLVVAERRAAPLSAAAFKAAAGALELLGVAMVGSIAEAVRDLARLGLWTVGLEGTAQQSLFDMDLLAEPVALVVGAEGKGLSRLVRDRVEVLASIPMSPGTESLNVAAAATLAAFEIARARAG